MKPIVVEIQDLTGEYAPICIRRGMYDAEVVVCYSADEAEHVANLLYATAQLLRAHEAVA